MAKVKDYHVYGTVEYVNRLRDDYEFLGRECKVVEPGHLQVFALPRAKPKVKSEPRNRANSRKED